MSIFGAFAGNKKTPGSDAGNALMLSADDAALAQKQLANLLNYQGNQQVLDPIQGSRTATDEVMNNAILGQVFGQGGTMGRAAEEEKNLASRGYSLQPEDFEAYGQGSDQIAREFGTSESNLAQALANRGMSSSAMAGQSFAGLQGNKMERLGQLQRTIANDRMKSNMERLGQTRSFLQGLSNQAGNEISAQNQRQLQGEGARFGQLMDKNSAAQSRLMAMQNQGNLQHQQRLDTQETPGWVQGLSGVEDLGMKVGGAMAGGPLGAAMAGQATKKGGGLS